MMGLPPGTTLRFSDGTGIAVNDGRHTGLGEVSHSNDDPACLRKVRELFTAVLAAGPDFELLAVNELDEGCDASLAIVDDTIYLRGRRQGARPAVEPLDDIGAGFGHVAIAVPDADPACEQVRASIRDLFGLDDGTDEG